jgi:acetoin utilization protein AcuB
MPNIPTIGSAMTPFPYFIEFDAHAAAAKAMMRQFKIHHLPVRDGDRIVGVISEQDLSRAQRFGRDISTEADTRATDVCTPDVCVVDPEQPLDAVLAHMAGARVDVVCIVKDGKLIGIYTFTDACRQFAELLRAQSRK